MRVMQQSESTLPERAPGVHEYRAALASVFLHADARGDLSDTLPPEMQPLPLKDAVGLINTLPDRLYVPARDVAGCKLAVAALVQHRDDLEPHLRELLNMDSHELTKLMRTELPHQPAEGDLRISYDQLRQVFYGESAPRIRARFRSRPSAPTTAPPPQASPQQSSKPKLVTKAEVADVQTCFTEEAVQPIPPPPESTLNLTSLVTTVDIPSQSNCEFAFLARALDPRSWSLSPFWPESYRVQSSNGSGFTRAQEVTPQIGESWNGYLFEHVEFNWNLDNIAAFENFLDIRFVVDRAQQQLRLDFALYSCESSLFYALEFPRKGIDVDSGFQCVAPLPPAPGQKGPLFRVRTVKNIRYADFLDRTTPDQGPAGAGQALRYVAPAVVGLWMNELVSRLYRTS
jgi:hypothetical protein